MQARHDAENNEFSCGFSTIYMQRFNAYESGVLPMVDSIRSFYNLHVARMAMPAFMHACDTSPVLLLCSAGSCMQIAHVSVLPTSPLLAILCHCAYTAQRRMNPSVSPSQAMIYSFQRGRTTTRPSGYTMRGLSR